MQQADSFSFSVFEKSRWLILKFTIKLFILKFLLLTLWCPPSLLGQGYSVYITESQSFHFSHIMDINWYNHLSNLGHTCLVVPVSTLDNTNWFPNADILIVSSGVIAYTPTHIATIRQFVESGKSVYIQGEYICSYSSNQAFEQIVNHLGGSFNYIATTAGDLQPMNTLGSFRTYPSSATSLSYFWWGCYGQGCSVNQFLEYQGNFYGFHFCPPNPAHGVVIQTTDQDWVGTLTSVNLMTNIFEHLVDRSLCSVNLFGQVNLGPDTTFCGSFSYFLNAGNPGSSFQWNTGSVGQSITATAPGIYSVTVTAPGPCVYTDSVVISSGSGFSIQLMVTNESCNQPADGAVFCQISNPGSYFYSWSNGVTSALNSGLSAGVYSITVTNQQGCQEVGSATVFIGNPQTGPGPWVWTGIVSQNWFDPCNWNLESLPNLFSPVIIPGGTPWQPVISGNVAICRDIVIHQFNGALLTIDVASGGFLQKQP